MIKVLVPVSGGKDSQTCLKLALQAYPSNEVLGLFCDTQFEHPKTYAHVDWMESHYGVKIDRVCGGSVIEKSLKYKRFPGGGARHCTDELKIRETKIFVTSLAKAQGGFEVWYGMRSDESHERKTRYAGKIGQDLYEPHEILRKYPKYLGQLGVRFRVPILDWSTLDVLEYLDGQENPLYMRALTVLDVSHAWHRVTSGKKKPLTMMILAVSNMPKSKRQPPKYRQRVARASFGQAKKDGSATNPAKAV